MGILLAFECVFSSAHAALAKADSRSNTAFLLYKVIVDLTELQTEIKLIAEKIEMLKEKLESLETSTEGETMAEKVNILEEK